MDAPHDGSITLRRESAMNQSRDEVSANENDKTDLMLSSVEQLQQDLHLAKCEIKTAIRDVAINQKFMNDLYLKLRADFNEINERLHGIELHQQRQNSST
jgi:hypothetical protein